MHVTHSKSASFPEPEKTMSAAPKMQGLGGSTPLFTSTPSFQPPMKDKSTLGPPTSFTGVAYFKPKSLPAVADPKPLQVPSAKAPLPQQGLNFGFGDGGAAGAGYGVSIFIPNNQTLASFE